MRILLEDINEFLLADGDGGEYKAFTCFDADEGEQLTIEGAFDACTPAMSAWHKEHGLYIESGILNVDPAQLNEIRAMAEAIQTEYDSDEETRNEMRNWERFELGSHGDGYLDESQRAGSKVKLTDYKRARIMRIALREILSKLTGIDNDELSTAESQIVRIASEALKAESSR